MNKKELLSNLASLPFVVRLNGEAYLNETKGNGDRWYTQNYLEVVDTVGCYRNIDFYVINEGNPDELAFYKDQVPKQTVEEQAKVDIQNQLSTATLTRMLTDAGLDTSLVETLGVISKTNLTRG